MKVIKGGGITSAPGFKASGVSCGIKRSGKPDLALISCDFPTVAAGVFTKNSVKAAPLIVTQKNLRDSTAQAIVINSGNANCFTGDFGLLYAIETMELISKLLCVQKENVLVSSTGIIGKPLPFGKIKKAAPQLVKTLSRTGGKRAAKAILTTDTKLKEIAVKTKIGGKTITVGGCAKGAGMVEPNMATMLGFITTDTDISPTMLKLALKNVTAETFNCITIDGCMSTNDMVVTMANGFADNRRITKKGSDFQKFCEALHTVCLDLAKKIVLDGEGATKFIEINVHGAKTAVQAKTACFKIANSNLVKTAAYGSNPNWGRVAAAVGSLGLKVKEDQLKIQFSPFTKKHITIDVELPLGKHKATVYTSDLSLEYVRINGKYN